MAKIYHAPKPEYTNWEWFKFIAVRTVFPPVMLWDLLKIGANKLLGDQVGGMILPAQNIKFDHLAINDELVNYLNEDNLTCEKHAVITHDEILLDTLEVQHVSQKNIQPKYQKYVINFVGNGMCYEHIVNEMKADAEQLQANVVGFNLRGVGQSQGRATSKDNLVTDGIAQIQRLLDQGISPQNITLKGHSLGGGVSALVAQHFHQLGKPINVFNSRSFSSLSNFVIGHVRLERNEQGEALGQKETFGGKVIGWLIAPFIKLALALTKWEIDAGSAFKNIPDAYRDHIVVRSKKNRDERVDDAVIPHYASIHKELSSERRAKKSEFDEQIKIVDQIIEDAGPSAHPNLIQMKDDLVQARKAINGDRKMEANFDDINGHNEDWNSLHNRSGKSAQTFFKEFIQRAQDDHAVKNTPQAR